VATVTDHREQVEQLLADYRRGREQLASVQRALRSITESAASSDGLVVVTVGAQGQLTAVSIGDDAYRRYRPADLAALITRLAGKAAATAGERANQALLPALPPDTDPAAVLAGRADLTPEEIDPEPPAATRTDRPGRDNASDHQDDPDDSYEHTSWLQGTPKRRW
jgi:DNA-binding protein YbaB